MTHQENLVSAQIDGGLHEKQTLLDDFAKAAMHAILTTPKRLPEMSHERLAKLAYAYAEAMMQERERRMKG